MTDDAMSHRSRNLTSLWSLNAIICLLLLCYRISTRRSKKERRWCTWSELSWSMANICVSSCPLWRHTLAKDYRPCCSPTRSNYRWNRWPTRPYKTQIACSPKFSCADPRNELHDPSHHLAAYSHRQGSTWGNICGCRGCWCAPFQHPVPPLWWGCQKGASPGPPQRHSAAHWSWSRIFDISHHTNYGPLATFLENIICFDVACKYYRLPYEWVSMTSFRIRFSLGLASRLVTGELSKFVSTYCTSPSFYFMYL